MSDGGAEAVVTGAEEEAQLDPEERVVAVVAVDLLDQPDEERLQRQRLGLRLPEPLHALGEPGHQPGMEIGDVIEATAHRLVELSTDDPDGAAAAARAGLRLVPHSQLLWRDLLRAEYDGPGGPGVAAAVDEMWVVLAGRDADLDAETEALVEELVPGWQPLVG